MACITAVTTIQFMACDLPDHVLHNYCRWPSVASFHYTQDSWCHNQDVTGCFPDIIQKCYHVSQRV
jgi:hypothetical protein